MFRIWLGLVGGIVLAQSAPAVEPGFHTELIGSTVPGITARSNAQIDLSEMGALVLRSGREEVRIPYLKIEALEYGQNVTRRFVAFEEMGLRQLRTVRRVYVDRLTGGETAAQMHDILVAALDSAKLFILTENPERADATLKGAAEDLVFTDVHSSSDNINGHSNFGNRNGGRYGSGVTAGLGLGEGESEHSAERRHEAIAAVRLVNKDGDVIWSTTQESEGAKFRGASSDVAEKITLKLKEDFERARRLR